ncbi:MAG: hypothetical protein M1834_000192, partial [Cirrosporium novae-zelandiae]
QKPKGKSQKRNKSKAKQETQEDTLKTPRSKLTEKGNQQKCAGEGKKTFKAGEMTHTYAPGWVGLTVKQMNEEKATSWHDTSVFPQPCKA